MIKFEFELREIDAENLISIIDDYIAKCQEQKLNYIGSETTRVDDMNRKWYEGHIEYVNGLKSKIAAGSSRIE